MPIKKQTRAAKAPKSRTAPAVALNRVVSGQCRACEIFEDGPCSPKAFANMQESVAKAIHREHNRHEGLDTPWLGLHQFQRSKYRGKAYAALIALGIPAPASANTVDVGRAGNGASPATQPHSNP